MQFIEGVAQFLCLAVGAAFISRLAKNFQDYFANVMTQKMGMDIVDQFKFNEQVFSILIRPL